MIGKNLNDLGGITKERGVQNSIVAVGVPESVSGMGRDKL